MNVHAVFVITVEAVLRVAGFRHVEVDGISVMIGEFGAVSGPDEACQQKLKHEKVRDGFGHVGCSFAVSESYTGRVD